MICFRCKKRIPDASEYCPDCGAFQGFNAELTGRARLSDQAAIAELYEKTKDNVYYTVRSVIKNEDTILDLVQDSFVQAFENLDKLGDPTKFRAWIKTIARNMSINYLKRKKPTLFSEMSDDEDYDPSLNFEDDRLENLPDVVIDRRETTRLMREILDTLSEDQRLVVGLFYYQNISVKRIAERLGVSENTVKSRLFQGRKKIETKVKELEKQGTKLYSVSPIAFLLLLFRSQDASPARIPGEEILSEITRELSANASAIGKAGTAQRVAERAAQQSAKAGAKHAVASGSAHAAKTAVGGGSRRCKDRRRRRGD